MIQTRWSFPLACMGLCALLFLGLLVMGASSSPKPTSLPALSNTRVASRPTSVTSHKQVVPLLKGVTVLFDQNYGQTFSPYNPTLVGYSQWVQKLREWGASVQLVSQPLQKVLKNRGSNTVLILGVAVVPRYEKLLPSVIRKFVERGGGVLLMVEHDNLFSIATNQNKISQMFGMRALPKGIFNRRRDTGNKVWIWGDSSILGLDRFQLYYVAPLQLKPPAIPLILAKDSENQKHRVMAALHKASKGRFVLLGDAEVFWNGTKHLGLQHVKNLEFSRRLIALLAGRSWSKKQPTSQQQRKPVKRNVVSQPSSRQVKRPKVVFVSSSLGLSPSEQLREFARFFGSLGYGVHTGTSPSLLKEAELVVVAQPVLPLKHVPLLLKAKRLLLIGDGMSDFLRPKPKLQKLMKKLLKGPVYWPIPMDALTVPLGFRFAVGTVLSSQKNPLQASVKWKSGPAWAMWRGTVLKPAASTWTSGWRVEAVTQPNTWWTQSLMPIHNISGLHENPFHRPKEKALYKGGLAVVASSKRVFAVADVEPFLNATASSPSSKRMWKRIEKWLRAKLPASRKP